MADTTAPGSPVDSVPEELVRSRLGLPSKLAYGFGSVAYGVAGITISSSLLTYYLNRVMGLPAFWVGTVLMLTLMVDAVIDPLIGQFSDRLRGRLGRRHPLMYAAAPITAVVLLLFYHAPLGISPFMLGAYLIVLLVLLRLSISLYEVPSSALAPELTPNYHERTGLMSYRYFFGVIGGLVMNVVLYRVYLNDNAHGGMLNRAAYGDYAMLAGAVIFFSIMISALGTQREVLRFKPLLKKQVTLADMVKQMSITLTNRSLLVVMLSGLLSGVAAGLGASLSLYFQVELWHLNQGQLGYLQFAGLPVSFLAVIIATPISKALGKKHAMIGLFSVSFVTGMIPLFLNLIHVLPSDGSTLVFWVLFIDALIAGTLGITGFIIVSSMVVDIVEDAAVQTGERSEGLLLATNGLLPKFTNAIGVWIGGIVLTVVNFPRDAPQGTVDMDTMRTLAIFYLPIYALMTGLAIGVLGWYRIDKETHERNVATLAEAAARAEEGSEATDGATPSNRPGAF
jgi:Na+/melibiose symporter-like transporter